MSRDGSEDYTAKVLYGSRGKHLKYQSFTCALQRECPENRNKV